MKFFIYTIVTCKLHIFRSRMNVDFSLLMLSSEIRVIMLTRGYLIRGSLFGFREGKFDFPVTPLKSGSRLTTNILLYTYYVLNFPIKLEYLFRESHYKIN